MRIGRIGIERVEVDVALRRGARIGIVAGRVIREGLHDEAALGPFGIGVEALDLAEVPALIAGVEGLAEPERDVDVVVVLDLVQEVGALLEDLVLLVPDIGAALGSGEHVAEELEADDRGPHHVVHGAGALEPLEPRLIEVLI